VHARLCAAIWSACRLTLNVRFDATTGQLDTRALRDLQRLPALLEAPPFAGKSLMLFGFTDGADRFKAWAISRARADTVAAQLRARGLDVIAVRGFGADMPVADDTTEEGREKNRRVEIWLR
jgi:phosphate transport system substrate-binding protein